MDPASANNGTAPVSVVVPCYRCADTIERAIRSVAGQSRRPAELILVDDASADRTGALLQELRERYGRDWIRILTLERNLGPASARNAGWDAATRKYVAFLDADDAWHPRKLEIQCAWMEAHPEYAVTGHASRQLQSEPDTHDELGKAEAETVTKAALLASNRFITPSVMLRREISQRFETGKRHMEDYLLWLEIASGGQKIARLPQVLAYIFKAPFGEGGLSAQAWEMEKGELAMLSSLRRKGHLAVATWALLCAFSLAKFLRRLAMLAVGYSPGDNDSHPSYLFPAAYMMLTQAMTALLVGAGLLGQRELAADIGIVQAATLATFFAFSGNARNLILTTRTTIPTDGILAARIALVLPLGALALLLSVVIARVDGALALLLVARRAVEWIGELELSENERLGDHSAAMRDLLLQGALLAVVLLVVALAPSLTYWALGAWALVPLVSASRFVATGLRNGVAVFREAIVGLLPHYGSTSVIGVSLYAYRTLLVLVAGRAVAGDLFVAFAVGSLLGTLFANVLGPSFSLHEERSGRAYLPRLLWGALLFYAAAGTAILATIYFAPGSFDAAPKSQFFWQALGWSLLGGVAMVAAQRARLRLLARGRGDDVFGADVMIHVLLIAAVPALYATGSDGRLATLYALNAALAVVFYATCERGVAARLGARVDEISASILAFCVFFPLFVLVTGAIYNPAVPLVDSGGVIRNLPLPLSLFACYGGILVLGRYRLAAPGLWTILGLLVMMLLSCAMLSSSDATDRAKMLLLLQVLLPTFGLVLGAVVDPNGDRQLRIDAAILAVVALIVPAQLIASWLGGTYILTHQLFAFGVYQHFEFVPVILAAGFLVALPTFWARSGSRAKVLLAALFGLLAVYAVAAVSVSGMLLVVAGAFGFALLRGALRKDAGALATSALALAAMLGYGALCRDSNEFHHKFSFLFPQDDDWAVVSGHSECARPSFGAWVIDCKVPTAHILRVGPTDRSRRALLVLQGELMRGAIVVNRENPATHVNTPKFSITQLGPFRAEIEIDRDLDDRDVLLTLEATAPQVQASVRTVRWVYLKGAGAEARPRGITDPPQAAPAPAPAAAMSASPAIPRAEPATAEAPAQARNVTERVSDWMLFGAGVIESPRAFLFGHEKAMPREIRTSAHNFYIDFAYNFGVLALLPLFALMGFTLSAVWRRRHQVLASESLLAHAAVVLFLVLVESNAKVALRQPYPGIALYFLLGLLLARLRMLETGPSRVSAAGA